MKNLKRLLILLILCVPCFVKADMGAPMLREFEIVVVNPNGVDYEPNQYSDVADPHLAKNQVVVVDSEYYGKYHISVRENDGTLTSLGEISSLDGFSIVQEEVDPTKTENDNSIKKFDKKQKAIVYNENGVSIYQGPSTIYKVVGTIKKGVNLEYQYAIDGEGGITYIYVDYNGKKGWVEILNKNVLIENDTQFIFRINVETECGTIPKNSISKPEFKTDKWSGSTLFEYKGCKTLIKTFKSDDVMTLYKSPAKSKVEIPVYDDSDKSNLITTIPANADLTYYTGSDSQMGTIDIHYVEYDGKRGWAFVTYDAFEIDYENTIRSTDFKDTLNTEKKKEIKKETKKEEKKNNKILGLDAKEFTIICTGAGVIVALTALVIILLVNKKKSTKKNKIVEKKEEDDINKEE